MIRDMRDTDLSTVLLINQANVPAVGHETVESLYELFVLCSIALVIEINDHVRGFCMLLPPSTAYKSPNYLYFQKRYDHFIYLDRIAIADGDRNQGWGPLLYAEAIKRSDAEWFTLEVNVVPPNEGSLRFHLREGFKELSQEETRPGKIVSLMSKRL
jgi:uncharacterized protein